MLSMRLLNRLRLGCVLCAVSCSARTVVRPPPRLPPPEPRELETADSSSDLRARVVACELVDAAAVKVWVVLANPNASVAGLVLPAIASGRETTPEFAEFRDAMDTPEGLGQMVHAASTLCGPGPGTRVTLEPGQSVTRSVVFPIARWENAAATESTVRWRWREFNLERPYEEARTSACTTVALALEQGHCSLKAERTVRCPPAGSIDVDLAQSEAEPPRP